MRFVSRAQYDAMETAYRQQVADERDRYERLVKETLGMVREGYRVQPVPVDAPPLPELPDAVELAIASLAGSRETPLGRQLTKYAYQQAGAGVGPDDILRAIRDGGD